MRFFQHNRGANVTRLRCLVVLLVVVSLLAPKLSLTASLWLGEQGFRTVIICNGSQLQRVTIAPNNEIVEDDITTAWVAPHCVLSDHGIALLVRAWQSISYPQQASVSVSPQYVIVAPRPYGFGQLFANRGPPPVLA